LTHEVHESFFRIYEMIGGIDHHSRVGISGPHVSKRKEDSWCSIAIEGLKNYSSRKSALKLLASFLTMPGRNQNDLTFRTGQEIGTIKRVLKEGPCPHERTVLLGPMPPQPPLDQWSQPHSFASCQYNRPEIVVHFPILSASLLFTRKPHRRVVTTNGAEL